MATKKGAHESREQELRDSEPVHEVEDEEWEQSLSLTAPPPRKGMRQRWIRVFVGGRDDHQNISRKLRDGWKPRDPGTVPNSEMYPKIEDGRWGGFIGIKGSVLMEIPEKRAQAREKFYRKLNHSRTAALDSQLQRVGQALGGKGFGPITAEKESKQVREVRVAADEE